MDRKLNFRQAINNANQEDNNNQQIANIPERNLEEQISMRSQNEIIQRKLKRYFSYKEKLYPHKTYRRDIRKRNEDSNTKLRIDILQNSIQEIKNEPASDRKSDSYGLTPNEI